MYVNFWYPMALSTEITDAPLRVGAIGQQFALFRDSTGKAHCLANVCAHRGGSLGSGKLVGDRIQCPYHGWEFEGTGICGHIPTLPQGSRIPGRARVDSYPVEERYGITFAFLGSLPPGERPPILDVPQWEAEGWSVTSFVYGWDANFERVMENALDATHTEFVHPSAGMQGGFKPGDELEHRQVEHDWGGEYLMTSATLKISHGHHGPNHHWTFLDFNMEQFDGKFRFYSFIRPVDEGSVQRYLLHARDFQLGNEMDEQMIQQTLGFEQEDRRVIEDMRPRLSPLAANSELLLPEDQIMVQYRRLLSEWNARGWRIDSEQAERIGARQALAVPCPARLEHKNWVAAPVPLQQPATQDS